MQWLELGGDAKHTQVAPFRLRSNIVISMDVCVYVFEHGEYQQPMAIFIG